jgi:hypothetical protein
MTTTPSTRIGKTIVAACVGSIFAQLRQDDRVVAIDADTAFGELGARVDPHATGSYWDLAGSPTSTSTPSPRALDVQMTRRRHGIASAHLIAAEAVAAAKTLTAAIPAAPMAVLTVVVANFTLTPIILRRGMVRTTSLTLVSLATTSESSPCRPPRWGVRATRACGESGASAKLCGFGSAPGLDDEGVVVRERHGKLVEFCRVDFDEAGRFGKR